MRDGSCKVDVSHAFAAHDGARDLDAAFLADDAAETDATVLAAVAFVIFFRTEYALIEETAFFGTLRAIVDGFGLRDLAIRPLEHAIRRSESHCHSLEICGNDIFSFLHCHS